MDRYVIREPRAGASYPQGNQMMAFPINAARSNTMLAENVYYNGPYANQFPNAQNVPYSNFMDVGHMNAQQNVYGQNMMTGSGQVMTGIDPRYLANYADNSAQFIVTGQQMHGEKVPLQTPLNAGFGTNYSNHTFLGADRNKAKSFTPQVVTAPQTEAPNHNINRFEGNMKNNVQTKQYAKVEPAQQNQTNAIPKTSSNTNITKKEPHNQVMSRMDKLKALHKSGPRAFSGPVEKVLKWHKALQDIGVFVFYEIVAKCVSIRPGESYAKNLVIRDENGPAMQVVYYEIDFMLPDIQPSSTIRVIGRMMAGTCRLQAFSVRLATGDDVATLQRRAAVAAHHVARLCKDYGNNPV
ncbi:uncharacterized protein LOC113499026 [Trichoplusia ni]|uniref:Uncharacterized protein LOC113499026 n=1 Tax=Trichoplusia ni TaxID=7111 RepID=A0A7E5W3Q8_TRINI|nr:uncharacterized protein LOC113499026 [Trichoplusia ni]